MKIARRQLKTLVLAFAMAGLTMGNEGCEEAKTRVLKLDVEVGRIAAQPIKLPSGETINFPYVANSLFYRSVMNSDHFVMMNPVPAPAPATLAAQSKLTAKVATGLASKGDGEISSHDEAVLSKYDFLKKLPATGTSSKGVNAKSVSQAATLAPLPICLYDLPQAQLKGEVVSFEATWGVGIGIGYGSNGSPIDSGKVAGSVQFKQSRLDIGLRSEDPLNHLLLAQAGGVSHESTVNLGIDFNAGLPIGLDLFFKTPLANVVMSAFDKALVTIIGDYKKMRSDNNSWDDVWESRVMYDPDIVDNDTYIAFRGGYRYGMKKKDTFNVTNMYYKWEKDPCTSALKYKITRTPTPVAEVEVVDVGDNVAVAKVTKYLIEQRIEPGAQVTVAKLYQPEQPKPKK
ncbi:MAG: hypothetical protein V4760_02115 [Bdellovibrionota bacterium]